MKIASSGSATPNTNKVGKLSQMQIREIAQVKMPDLTAASEEAAMTSIIGTALSMGIEVEGVSTNESDAI